MNDPILNQPDNSNTRTRLFNEWLFLRIYVGKGDCTDEALLLAYEWLSTFIESNQIDRWYFLRYIDNHGHHLRLRIRSDADTIDELYSKIPHLEKSVLDIKAREVSRIISDPLTTISGGRHGIALGVYSPEIAKYGGKAGVDSAEKHFETSSVWCIQNKVWTLTEQRERMTLAARYLALVFSSLGDNSTRTIELEHTKRWAQRLPAKLRNNKSALERLVYTILNQEARYMDFNLIYNSMISCSNYLPTKDKSNRRTQRILDLVHMDMNRFGLNIPEECAAGIAARFLNSN